MEFIFQIFKQKVSKPTKTSKKDRSFYNTLLLKKPHSFYQRQLPQHSKKIYSCNTAKNFTHFINFPAHMFLIGLWKKICTKSFLNAQELYSWRTVKANVYIYLYISVRKFLLQRCRKFLYGERGGGLKNFLKTTQYLSLIKSFKNFHLNWKFWKFNYFCK